MSLGQRRSQPAEQAGGIDGALRDLYQDLYLILDSVPGIEMDAELVHLFEFADDCLDGARVDVRPADQLHVVDPASDAAFVEIERSAAAAFARGDAHHQVTGPVAQHGNETPSKGRVQPLAQLAFANRSA